MPDISAPLSSLLRRCCPLSALKPGQQTHTQILTHGLSRDPTLLTSLFFMYSRCSLPSSAHHQFDRMPQRSLHSFNALISSYVRSSLFPQSLSLFPQLLASSLTPDHYTLPPLFKSCATLRLLPLGAALHCCARRLGLYAHLVVTTSILDMYLKLGRTDNALRLFDGMTNRDAFSWNSMITGLVRADLSAEALGFFRMSQHEGGEMDAMAVPSVLSACGREGELRRGKEVHGRMMRSLVVSYDAAVNNSLIEMYAKCGCLVDSFKVFLAMGKHRNVVSWSTLISCCGVHGKGKEALALYEEMIGQGIKPNSITFTSILSSCSHSGLVEEGQRLFDSMSRDHGLEPSEEHYACMVDLLGRAGHIRRALRLIEDMRMEPTGSVWGALLGACTVHGDVEIGEVAAHKLFELEPQNCGNYVALCSIYEMVGMLENVARMRERMRDLGIAKTPGCSWIDMKGIMYAFYQGDIYVPSSKKLCELLYGLLRKTMTLGGSNESSSSHSLEPYGHECY